jgi:hypothetical protein
MVIGELRTSSAAMRVNSRVAVLAVAVAPVVRAELAELAAQGAREALAEPAVPVVLAVRVALVVPEDPAVRVALAVPEDPAEQAVLENPVVPAELELVQVAAEREPARAVAELEHGPVEAEREPDQVAVPLRIKSVIGVHHRGRVPLLAVVEDLAAVVETTRDPAATEAGTAWVAAV